jgi:hypothetical protein
MVSGCRGAPEIPRPRSGVAVAGRRPAAGPAPQRPSVEAVRLRARPMRRGSVRRDVCRLDRRGPGPACAHRWPWWPVAGPGPGRPAPSAQPTGAAGRTGRYLQRPTATEQRTRTAGDSGGLRIGFTRPVGVRAATACVPACQGLCRRPARADYPALSSLAIRSASVPVIRRSAVLTV